MKRVLIFSLAYFPKYVGGAEVSVKEITDRTPDIEFHMVTNRFDRGLPQEEKIGNVLVHRIGIATDNPTMVDLKKFPLNLNKPLFQFLAAWKAVQLNRTYRYDGTWAVMAHAAGVPAVLFKMWNPQAKFVLNLQEGDPTPYIEKKMMMVWPLFVRAFRRADLVQALSNYLAEWARRMGYRGAVEVIPNAVDAKRFAEPQPAARINLIKDTLGKKMGEIFLITTSRLVRKNAVDDVIRALPLLPENVTFLVLGVGPDEEALQSLARELKVTARVRFLGQISHADMPAYLQAADIFIRPSRSEGFGASFPEAMAAGLPVIATQEGGIADFLFDEERNPDKPVTGFAVDRDSPEDIARAVQRVMAHPEKTRAVVATARAMVLEKYDWNTIARDMRERVWRPLIG